MYARIYFSHSTSSMNVWFPFKLRETNILFRELQTGDKIPIVTLNIGYTVLGLSTLKRVAWAGLVQNFRYSKAALNTSHSSAERPCYTRGGSPHTLVDHILPDYISHQMSAVLWS